MAKASKLQAGSPDSADWSINPAKTPRYGKKSTVVHRNFFIHRMLMIRVSVRPLRMRENFLFYEYSIFDFVMSRCILHFLGKKRDPRDLAVHSLLFQIKICKSQNAPKQICTDSRRTQLEGLLISRAKKNDQFSKPASGHTTHIQ
jgi:hypothetical protein